MPFSFAASDHDPSCDELAIRRQVNAPGSNGARTNSPIRAISDGIPSGMLVCMPWWAWLLLATYATSLTWVVVAFRPKKPQDDIVIDLTEPRAGTPEAAAVQPPSQRPRSTSMVEAPDAEGNPSPRRRHRLR
jgi:hypothetical protein